MTSPSFFRGPSPAAGGTEPSAIGARLGGASVPVDRPYAAPAAERMATASANITPMQAPIPVPMNAPVVFSEVVLRAAASRPPVAEAGVASGAVAAGGPMWRRPALASADATERAEAAAVVLEALAARLRRGERLLGDPTDPAVVAEVLSAMLAGKSRIG